MEPNNTITCPYPNPSLPAVVRDAIAGYSPRALSGPLADHWLDPLKALVSQCEPVSDVDAVHMLSTASRYFADTQPPVSLTLAGALSDRRVTQWLHRALLNGMPPQTLSNHRQRLARFQRVLRGLPARMSVRGVERQPHDPLTEAHREALEHALVDRPELLAAYVAAVGANLIASAAVGETILVEGGHARVGDTPIVHELTSLAAMVAGHTVNAGARERLRYSVQDGGVAFDRSVARATFAALVTGMSQPASQFGGRVRADPSDDRRRRQSSPDAQRRCGRGPAAGLTPFRRIRRCSVAHDESATMPTGFNRAHGPVSSAQ